MQRNKEEMKGRKAIWDIVIITIRRKNWWEMIRNFRSLLWEDNAAVFHSMAVEMVDEIKMHNAKGEKTVFICPVGPVGQYPYFVDMVNEQNISLKDVWFINMVEYLVMKNSGFPKIIR